MDDILMNAELEMDKAIENFEKRLVNIRAGRANPAILDGVQLFRFQKLDNYILNHLIKTV